MIIARTLSNCLIANSLIYIAAFVAMLVPNQESLANQAGKYNVLLIVVDDLRPAIGVYGNEIIKTPNIDALAERGIRFNRAYVQQATCVVSRASLFSGLRPDSMGLDLVDMKNLREKDSERIFFPQHFKSNGYYTASFGKIYHRNESDEKSWAMRGDNPKGLYCAPENKDYGWKSLGPPTEAADVPDDCYRDGKVADQVIEELGKLPDKPFFLSVGFFKPHLPFNAPKPYWDIYSHADIQRASRHLDLVGAPKFALTNFPELRAYLGVPKKGGVPRHLADQLVHGYYASVSYVDTQIGRVLNELERLDLHKETLVVLLGDHGYKLGEYDSWSKHTNFELDTRAPLIVAVPDGTHQGVSSNSIVEFIDIYPTISELAGLPNPTSIDGRSFSGLIENPHLPFKDAAFSQFQRGGGVVGYAVRTKRYRYVEWLNKKTRIIHSTEVYDHDADPDETVNISGKVSRQIRKELAIQLEKGLDLPADRHY